MDRLLQMPPTDFEKFARRLLGSYGFTEVIVTGT